jgi:hypothetical protein
MAQARLMTAALDITPLFTKKVLFFMLMNHL